MERKCGEESRVYVDILVYRTLENYSTWTNGIALSRKSTDYGPFTYKEHIPTYALT